MEPKFNLNREPINDDEINSKKDFGELVKKFKQESIQKAHNDSSFLKSKKATYSAIIAGVTVICTVTYFSVFKSSNNKTTTNDKIATQQTNKPNAPKITTAFINPPIKKVSIPYTNYKVNAQKGGVIQHPSKTKINIPKNAFVNNKGEDIIGDVEIKYKEFHNQADIITSGIPMKYDSAGTTYNFESAGMFDIKGYQNNEPVFINPKKNITIEFASQQANDYFNQYVLDTIAKNWVYIKRDNPIKTIILPARNNEIDNLENSTTKLIESKIAAIPPKIEKEKEVLVKKTAQLPKVIVPEKPNKSVNGRPQFQLDVNYKDYPELEPYKNAVFEVAPENKNYNPELSKITWSSATISEGTKKGKNYLLTLKFRQRVEQLIVYPVLNEKDYDNAIQNFDKKFDEYKTLLAKRENDERKLKEEFEAKQKAYIAEEKKYREELRLEQLKLRKEREEQLAENFKTNGIAKNVTRIFAINSFNTYNSDCPHVFPSDKVINPIFVHQTTTLIPEYVFVIENKKNSVYSYRNEPIKIKFNDTYSLCVINKGRLYVCSTDDFMNVVTANKNTFKLKDVSDEVNDVIDLKKAIGI